MEKKEETTIATHTCKRCGRTLPLDQFMKGPHGVTHVCLDCCGRRKKAKPAP